MSILEKILSLFSFSSDPKTIYLKKISKEFLLENPKYFHPKKKIFYKNFGKDLYYLYKIIKKFQSPLAFLFSSSKTRTITLKLFVHQLMGKEIVIYLNLLEDENIVKIVQKYGINKSLKYYQKVEKILLSKLNDEINETITHIFSFLKDIYEISSFNWETMLNKFCPSFSIKNKSEKNLVFLDIKVTDSFISTLEDFAFLIKNFNFKIEYSKYLQLYLQKYYKTKKINFNVLAFNKDMKTLQKLLNFNFSPFKLEKYLKYLKKDPDYKINLISNPKENYLSNYLSNKLQLAKIKLNNILIETKNSNTKMLVDKLFEEHELLKSTYYNEDVSNKLKIVDLPQLTYNYQFSITKSFIILFYEAKFKKTLSSLIFKAEFNDINISESLNNILHECNELLFKINNFEEDLLFLEKLYNIIMKNPNTIKSSKNLKANYANELTVINEKAKETIIFVFNTLKSLYNILSIIYEDIKNRNPVRIKNIINGLDKLYYNEINSFYKKLKIFIDIIEVLMEINK